MYHHDINEPRRMTSYHLRQQGQQLLRVETLNDLSHLLKTPVKHLKKVAENPRYDQFFIPKSSGGKRMIQNPNHYLKKMQKRLSYLFQGIYHPIKPDCAYGFIQSVEDEHPARNIYTNAERHIGKKWVLNIDMKDFFHTVSGEHVKRIFRRPPFRFTRKASHYLSLLVTHEGRLPMGAPTSPVLSNMACLDLDKKLSELSEENEWVYTRFADDMTFSSEYPITHIHIENITKRIEQQGFSINPKKIRLYREGDKAEVTGLVLGERHPDVSGTFVENIQRDIQLFHLVTDDRTLQRDFFDSRSVVKLERSIQGQINFVKFVRGEADSTHIHLRRMLDPHFR